MRTEAPLPIRHFGMVKVFARINAVLDGGEDGVGPTRAGTRTVTSTEIAAAKARSREGCHCEEHGLRPGLTKHQLISLGAGCRSPMYACPTLVRLRRMLEQ